MSTQNFKIAFGSLVYLVILCSIFLFNILAIAYIQLVIQQNEHEFEKAGIFNGNTLFIFPATGKNTSGGLQLKDLERLSKIEGISKLSPRINLGSDIQTINQTDTLKALVYGEDADYLEIEPLKILSGRFFTSDDIVNKKRICCVGSELQEGNGSLLNSYITIENISFKVIGIFKSEAASDWANWRNKSIFIPYSSLQQIFGLTDSFNQVSISTKKGINVREIEKDINKVLDKKHIEVYNYAYDILQLNKINRTYVTAKIFIIILTITLVSVGLLFSYRNIGDIQQLNFLKQLYIFIYRTFLIWLIIWIVYFTLTLLFKFSECRIGPLITDFKITKQYLMIQLIQVLIVPLISILVLRLFTGNKKVHS